MLQALLAETLALWGVDGEVVCAESGVATITADRALVWIEPVEDRDLPFRWLVKWRASGEAAPGARERHPRACASVVGVLAALRSAFGIERGAALRVAAATVRAEPFDFGCAYAQDRLRDSEVEGQTQTKPGSDPNRENRGQTPLIVITGFLGSGKTTLLSRLLRDPSMRRTAVIINEFGEVGLDHDLVETSDESFVELSNGCLCCKARSDLVLTLSDLAARRAAGSLPAFDRVVIETTGLADPAPILNALATDAAVAETYALAGVVTTVDSITGLQTLAQHAEAARQAALADCILVTKSDLPEGDVEGVTEGLAPLNTTATILPIANGDIAAAALFDMLADARSRTRPDPPRTYAPNHLHGIGSVCITRARPLHAATLPLVLSALAENLGADLLRVKGIVAVAEAPDTPAVVHGVQHVCHAPSWLPRWPGEDRSTRLVVIGRRLRAAWLSALLEAVETEVVNAGVAVGSTVA